MPGIWGIKGDNLIPVEMQVEKTGTGITNSVGHTSLLSNTSWSGTTINSNIGAVTQITDPASTGGWTVLASMSGKKMVLVWTGTASVVGMSCANSEPAGRALRTQILVDGTIVCDTTVEADGVTTISQNISALNNIEAVYSGFVCEDSFQLRCAREGSFSAVGSQYSFGSINYWEIV